jgi:hypothetical protein
MSSSRRRLSSAIAGALAIGALTAPAANAITDEQWRGGLYRSDSTSAVESSNSPAPTVTRTIDDGFDLGSAAIGAGSAATILLLGGAGATMVARRRRVRLGG